ncbi:uncharacterized protein At4g26450 isoform X2 [Pistacia vera]|uniref:uncharacterized protein At4g26450 isoform X2 n=1 Tax=Pistacia vera TaxID=55513 RepID=UPI001263A5D4|nr:uncharacterized protein At4g26450 isoform X2 [Pistacia vera]
MHARHRSPGNGYRSNSMGMGMPPEGSARGRGFYSEYRSFNRGFGRGQGQPKSFQQLPPTPRKSDVFMEAGRLAAEYLVSQGLLPPGILSGKLQNGAFRSEDGENLQLPPEGRSSALARLGNSGSDVGSGRRRYPDDYNSMGLRNYLNRRKKGGSFKSNSLDWGREYGRSGSWSEKGRVSPDIEGDCDSYSGNQEEQQVSKDVGNALQKPGLGELAPKSEEASGLESGLEKFNIQDEMGSRASSSSVGKGLLHETGVEFSKKSVDSTNMDMEAGELKDEICDEETEEQDALEESAIKHYSLEDDTSTKSNNDLLTLCRFAKVPTKTRSSLTYKGLKVDSVSNNDVEKTSDTILPIGPEALVENNSLVSSAVDLLPDKTLDSKCPDSEISKAPHVQSIEGVGTLGSLYGVDEGQFMRSQSFPDRALMCDVDQELGQGLSGLQKSSSMVQERGEKRTMEEHDSVEATKKLREWFPSNEYSNISSMSDKKASSQEETATPCEVSLAVDPENSVNRFSFPRRGGEPCVEYAQEKQLFPGSFKICDLNLMEASDINENHHSDPTLIYPTIPKKEATPVDVDLSMSNSIMSGDYSRRTSDGKEIEIIDLENDSAQTEKASDNNSERKTETMFTGMEGFSNHVQNAGHIPDVQDNYDGLMITQLLNNFPDCPGVPVDINALQNEMAIHNGEVALGDDDSIYMSLGEIPLSFLRGWEQPPPQEYEKPF